MAMSPKAEATAVQVVLGSLLGVDPSVSVLPDGRYLIQYQGQNVTLAREKMNTLITAWRSKTAAREGGVVYDMGNVIFPVMLRQLWWVIALAGFGGYAIYAYGKKQGKKSGRSISSTLGADA